jgi:type II secretory pathway component PulF
MPLAAGVQAFSSQVGGIFQVWTETLAELLRRGLSLSESIESLPGLVPPPSRLLIRIGEQSGNLGQGIEQAVASRTVQLPLLRQIGTQIVYLFWVMCCGVFVSFFMMYFIMPRFEAIFKDFGIGLPDVTRNMMMLSHIVVNFSWIPILGGLAFTFAFLINYYTGGGMNIPLFDRLFARRHTILILRGLSISISASQPVSRLLDDLARCYPTNWIRKKLAIAAADVQAGHDWVASMYSTGLLKSSDLGVLTSAQRAGNLVWAVRELVETGERRWSFRLQWIMQLTFLTSMVIIGAIVLFIALAYFSPLIALIMRLSQ